MTTLIQPEHLTMLLKAIINVIETHEVLSIASVAVSSTLIIGSGGFCLGVLHQSAKDKPALEAVQKERNDLAAKLTNATPIIIEYFAVPATPTNYVTKTSGRTTIKKVRSLLTWPRQVVHSHIRH